jgi:GNAT superfamily N-acetyltransferase
MADPLAWVRTAGESAAAERLALYAACPGTGVRCGDGWFAVAAGTQSNDQNGVVSEPGAITSAALVHELIDWFARAALPASWLVTGDDAWLTAALTRCGAQPDNTGVWSGRRIGADVLHRTTRSARVAPVTTEDEFEECLDVAQACGWFDDGAHRRAYRDLYRSAGLLGDRVTHWLARRGRAAVGMGTMFMATPHIVELCNLAVIVSERRRGIGTALASARITAAHTRGARVVVSALSPDGWQLYRTIGFVSVPVTPNRRFFLPGDR